MNSKSLLIDDDGFEIPFIRNCGWIETIDHATHDNIAIMSADNEGTILFHSEYEGWVGFVLLNFSAN